MKPDLDLDLLRAFVTVAETRSFTRAARQLGRVQSAVSMQIKRLEDVVGQRLFTRNHRNVALSSEGEVLLAYARRMLLLNEEALSDLGRSAVEGTVRLGSADTAAIFLPGVLARFARTYPRTQLEVRCDRSWHLLDALEAGDLDLALVTQDCGRSGGRVVRREPLVWACAQGHRVHREDPLPVALFAQGCFYRKLAMERLDAAGRDWRVAYSSTSVTGVQAAALTGLAVAVLARSTLVRGLRPLGPDEGLPALPDYEITLYRAPGPPSAAVARLAEDIAENMALAPGSGSTESPRTMASA